MITASGGGAILNNASNLGVVGMASVAPYVAAKHGVVGLTRSVALETAAAGVRVNALVSGAVDTPAFRASMGATPEGEGRDRGAAPDRADRPARRDRGAVRLPAQRRGVLRHRGGGHGGRRLHRPVGRRRPAASFPDDGAGLGAVAGRVSREPAGA